MDTLAQRLARNPFPGLRSFHPGEADVFFGRQRQIDELEQRLDETRLIAVAGSSGCGKSSLVLAGLLRALAHRREAGGPVEWRPVVMRPGNAPIDNLAQALAAALAPAQAQEREQAQDPARGASLAGRLRLGGTGLAEAVLAARLPPSVRVLVIVDQFEEIFRYRRMTGADESAAFVKLLLNAALASEAPVNIVLTLRSDTLGYCADFRDLPEAVSRGQFLVPRLTREQRKQAITGPVERRGFRVAPRLVQRVLNDVSDDFDDLPVMQHALSCTWRHWAAACQGSRDIDVPDYEAIGAAAGALSGHADEAYNSLPGRGAEVERVFRALTERLAAGGSEVRRPLPFLQLCAVTGGAAEHVAAVVDRYRRADTVFLLPPPEVDLATNPVIDISHESLIRGWRRLKDWADHEALSVQMYRRIAEAAALHEERKEGLLRNPALQFALEWRNTARPNAEWGALVAPGFERAMTFLDASREAHEREQAANVFRSVLLRVAAFAVLVVSIGIAVWTNSLRLESIEARARLEKTNKDVQQSAKSRRLAAEAAARLATGELDSALLLSAAALQVTPSAEEAQEVMRSVLIDAPRRILHHEDEVTGLAFNRDGTQLVSAARDGRTIVWDPVKGEQIATLGGAAGELRNRFVAFAGDGTLFASPDGRGNLIVRDASGAQSDPVLEGTPPPSAGQAGAALWPPWVATAMASDPRLFAAADTESDPRVWSMLDGRLIPVPREAGRQVTGLAFSPVGKTLAVAHQRGVQLWNLDAAVPVRLALPGAPGNVRDLVFSPDGRTMAVAGDDRIVALLDVVRMQLQRRLPPQPKPFNQMVFSGDGRTLAVGDFDGNVTLWDVDTGVPRSPLDKAHTGQITRLAFSPDGRTLASGSLDKTIVLWNVKDGTPLARRLKAHRGSVDQLAFSPDGRTLASAGKDKAVILWDLSKDYVRHGVFDLRTYAMSAVTFDRAGGELALSSEDASVWLWDVAGGRWRGVTLRGHEDPLTAVAFSPDGRLLASGSEDKTVWLWDAASHKPRGAPLAGHDKRVKALAFSPDSGTLASGGRDGRVVLWNLADGQPRRLPDKHKDEVTSLAFHPGGRLLASASRDKSVIVWDIERRAEVGKRIPEAGLEVNAVIFSPDGKMLVTAADGKVGFWNAETGEALGQPLEHVGVSSLAFEPKRGLILASGGSDGLVRLWDVPKRAAIGEPFVGHDGTVWSLSFRADGKALASVDSKVRLALWDTDVAAWPERACRIVNRDIFPEEWPRSLRDTQDQPKVCPR